VYAKFEQTQDIQIGDTLKIMVNAVLTPCLVVTAKSSTSVVCKPISNIPLKKADEIIFHPTPILVNTEDEMEADTIVTPRVSPWPRRLKNVSGKLSASVNSNLAPVRNNSFRTMYRFSMDANHINDSKFSFETYINYSQNFNQNIETGLQKRDYLNVYNLAVRYDVDSSLTLTLGRKINNKASTLGVIDGLQAEKYFGKFYIGGIIGFRPDVATFTFNPNLIQGGGYVGFNGHNKKISSQTTMGYLQQTNSGKTDRSFAYFQHSSRLGRKTSIYTSLEMDLYNNPLISAASSPRLTNIYLSANYKLTKKIRFSVSFGSRKRILYYQTYPDQITQVLANDEARKGISFKVHMRPTQNTSAGLSFSNRFQNNSQNKSNNLNGYFSLREIPKIGGRLSVNLNLNTSNYFTNYIASISHSRTLIPNKLNAVFYLRFVNYKYLNQNLTRQQSYLGTSLNYQLKRKLTCYLLGEVSTQSKDNLYRLNFKIIQRF
tara:strand:+ start:61523 stop:62986 length:1464 start_codon:yes stop_codon:yes gene_type:complete